MAEYTIHLEGLEVAMGLGIHDAERAAPQRVTIDVSMDCAYFAPPEDRISAVVDYDFLREAGVQAIFGPGTNLIKAAEDVLRLLGHNMPPEAEAAE